MSLANILPRLTNTSLDYYVLIRQQIKQDMPRRKKKEKVAPTNGRSRPQLTVFSHNAIHTKRYGSWNRSVYLLRAGISDSKLLPACIRRKPADCWLPASTRLLDQRMAPVSGRVLDRFGARRLGSRNALHLLFVLACMGLMCSIIIFLYLKIETDFVALI